MFSLSGRLKLRAGRLGEVPSNSASYESPPESCSEKAGKSGRSLAEAVQQTHTVPSGLHSEPELHIVVEVALRLSCCHVVLLTLTSFQSSFCQCS